MQNGQGDKVGILERNTVGLQIDIHSKHISAHTRIVKKATQQLHLFKQDITAVQETRLHPLVN